MTDPAEPRMTRSERRAASRWLARVAWTQRRSLTWSVAGALLRQCGFLATPLLLQFAVDDSIVTGDVPAGLRWAGLLLAAAVVQFLGMCLWQHYANVADARAGALLRGRLLERLWHPAETAAAPAAADDIPTGAGDLVLRAGRDVDLVRTWLHGLPSWAVIGMTVAVLVPGIFGLDPMLLLVALGTVPALVLVNLRYPRRFERAAAQAATAHGRRADVVEHLLRSADTTRGIGAELALRDRHHERSAELTAATVRTGAVGARWSALGEGVPMVATAVGVLAAVVAIGENRLTVGGLVAFSGWMGTIGIAVTVGLARMSQAVDARVATRRLLGVLDLAGDPSVLDDPSGADIPVPDRPAGPARMRVTGLPTADGRCVDLDLGTGRMLAVTGPTGSGKSWLLRVLAGRERTPAGSSVRLDEVDIRHLDHETMCAQVVLVPQRPLVLTGTVGENLCLGETIEPRRLRAALSATGLDADFAEHGLDTVIADGAGALSGGQVQRLALARALLTPARVLLLDDVTSAIDPATERLVVDALRAAARDRIVVVATHRPALLAAASATLTLTGGRADLIGAGSPGDWSGPSVTRPGSVDTAGDVS